MYENALTACSLWDMRCVNQAGDAEPMIERRWWILAVLFVARVALGFQFQNVGSLAPFLVRDLGLDYAQIGILVGAFILPGVAISLPSGLLSRSLGDKRIVMLGMFL